MPWHPDDFVLWPDKTVATVGEVERDDFNWKSDDYENVHSENTTRLAELGVDSDVTSQREQYGANYRT